MSEGHHDSQDSALHRRTPQQPLITRTASVLNPSTGEVQAQVLLASAADVDTAVASAKKAKSSGPRSTLSAAPG